MRSNQVPKVVGSLLATSLMVQSCAIPPEAPSPPSESVRASLGKVGVVSVGSALGGTVSGPIGVGNEAAKGIFEGGAIGGASGAGVGAVVGLVCGPFLLVCVPVFASVGAVGGVVVGGGAGGIIKGTNAIPEGAATNIQAALYNAIAKRDLQNELRRHVLERANAGRANNAIDLGIGKTVDPSTPPDYALFTSSGVNTVLEITIAQIAFTSEGGTTPTFLLSIDARARVIQIPGNLVLWSDEHMAFKSPAAEFSLWIAKDSDLLKSEIESGLETLARQITETVLLKAPKGQRGPS
jgi:hypothetical protein